MGRIKGSQSIQFDKPVYILGAGSIVGKKKGKDLWENILTK